MTDRDGEKGLRIDALHGGAYEIVAFRDLPMPYKMAMAWYMAVDGEAWGEFLDYRKLHRAMPDQAVDQAGWHAFWKDVLVEAMPLFDAHHGDEQFGVALVPTEAVLASIVDDEVLEDEDLTLEDLRERYGSGANHEGYPEHGPVDRWPVILSSTDDETLQDGWHRFGSYVKSGHEDIPAIFYPQARHLEAKPTLRPPSP